MGRSVAGVPGQRPGGTTASTLATATTDAEEDGRARRQRRRRDDDRHEKEDGEGVVEPAGQKEEPAELEDVIGEQQRPASVVPRRRLAG